jgi:NADPH:quinone reductase-like Zn-dependent oxidoreductase
MKAVTISDYGSPEVLKVCDLKRPIPGPDQVLVEVKVAAVNPVDWKMRRGDLSIILPRKFPKVLGIDLAGVVAEVGKSVKQFQVGDRVFGMADPFKNQYGSYAEFSLVQTAKLVRMPDSLSYADAASLPVAGLTAYESLYALGAMRPGHHVLVNGASGGVGSFAVQLAKIGGATVTAVCGANNMEFVRSLGADNILDYKVSDVSKLSEQFAIIFDASAKLDYFRVKHLLTERGVFVTTVPKPETILAVALSAPFPGRKVHVVMAGMNEKAAQELAELANLVAAGKLRPEIAKQISLEELPDAHREGESEHTRGKVLVKVAE